MANCVKGKQDFVLEGVVWIMLNEVVQGRLQ